MINGRFIHRWTTLLMLAALTALAGPAAAQSRFSPAIQVGDAVITRYQLDQRTRFLALLNAPGDPRQLAREQLINETIQLAAAKKAGVEPSSDEVASGIEEFAARANLTGAEFVAALGQNGVEPETFRDFIQAGVAWRSLIREKFGDTARETVTPSQVRRTLGQTGTEGGLRVLISEIMLPVTTPATKAASKARAAELAGLPDEAAFAAAARRFSIARTSPAGGELGWMALEALPAEVQGIVRSLEPGQISRPVELPEAIGIFLMRDREQVAPGVPGLLSVDYALFVAEDGTSGAAAVAREVDTCDDLYGVAKGLPAERLIRETRPQSELPADVRAELDRLDENETSTALTRGGNATVLMLCERKPAQKSTVDFEIIGNRILNSRLGGIAADHLTDIRDSTVIVDLSN